MHSRRALLLFCSLALATNLPGAAPSIATRLADLEESARRETVLAGLDSTVHSLAADADDTRASRLAVLQSRLENWPGGPPFPSLRTALSTVLSAPDVEAQLRALAPVSFSVKALTPGELLDGETEAYRGVLCRTPLPGYSAEVQALEPGAPHSMEDVRAYVRHRAGGHVLDLALRQGWPVEFHEGPAGLALRSLRQRGYGSPRLLLAPGLGADRTDGFLAAFRMTDGAPVLAHAGARGRDRVLHAQALLRLAGVPGGRVTRFPHRYRLEDALSRLDLPAATPDDVAVLGLSEGPVRSLLRRMGLPETAMPAAESLGAPFLQMRRFRFQDADGREHRLLALGVFWGELAREAALELVRLGYRRIAFIGIAGGLQPDAQVGDIHHATAAVTLDGTPAPRIPTWLRLPVHEPGLVREARFASTWSPLTETRAQVEAWRMAGFTTVETELPYVLQGLAAANVPELRFDALAIVSDLPGGGAGKSLESRYFNRDAVARAGERCLEWLLRSMRATALQAETGPAPHSRERIGLFTGTFDPPHKGHLTVAAEAVRQLHLDRFFFVPNGSPRHKPNASPYRARSEMLWAAISQAPAMQMAAGPVLRKLYLERGPAGSLAQIRRELGPEKEYFQVMGADSFLSLVSRPAELAESLGNNRIAAFLRPGSPDAELRAAAARQAPGKVIVAAGANEEATSSTALRNRLRSGEPAADWIPSAAESVLRYWRLYGTSR